MLIRPVDASGDVLPVLSSRDLLSGPETVAQLVRCRLSLLQGEWWEYPEEGFFILERMQESRVTEADAASISSRITAYIRETPGVQAVRDVACSVDGRRFSFSCTVDTEDGPASVGYSF